MKPNEAGTKSGGAVVVPRDAHVQRAVDATEIAASANDGTLTPSDVQIETPAAMPTRAVLLVFDMGRIYFMCIASVALVVAWCGFFLTPYTWETRDANAESRDDVRARLKSLETILSVPRTVLSSGMNAIVGTIVALVCVNSNLQTAKSNGDKATEWFLKYGIPSLFCLPLVGLIFQEQPMDIVVAIGSQDLGVHNSLLVTAADQAGTTFGYGSMTRTATTDTILRRVLLPPRNQRRQCDLTESQSANAFTSVAYEFLANEWQVKMLPIGRSPTETYVVPGSSRTSELSSNRISFSRSEAALVESLFTRGVYLYADAVLVQDADLGGVNTAALKQLKLDTIDYASANNITTPSANGNGPTDHVTDFVRSFFATTPAWSSLLRANVADINVEYAKFNISDDISFTSVNIDIPLDSAIWHRELVEINDELVEQSTTWSGSGPVTYEFDVANECGPKTCGIQNRGLAPDPKVVAYGVCLSDGSDDCAIYTSAESMWLFGFGRRIEGDRLELLDPPDNATLRKAVLTSPREYHRITMGLLAFKPRDLSETFDAECRASSGCEGVSMQLTTNYSEPSKFVTVSRQNMPMLEFGSGFDLAKNHARGRPLVTRYTTGASVEFEILRPENVATYVWPTNGLRGSNCSGKMERSIITTELNHVYMERPLQPTYTAALFFLFHNAPMTARVNGSREMDFRSNDRAIRLALTVPYWQALAGLIDGACSVLMVLLVFMRYHKQISVASAGPLQIPSVFVRAFADSSAFPSWFVKLKLFSADPQVMAVDLHELPFQSVVFGPLPRSQDCLVISPPVESDVAKTTKKQQQVQAQQ